MRGESRIGLEKAALTVRSDGERTSEFLLTFQVPRPWHIEFILQVMSYAGSRINGSACAIGETGARRRDWRRKKRIRAAMDRARGRRSAFPVDVAQYIIHKKIGSDSAGDLAARVRPCPIKNIRRERARLDGPIKLQRDTRIARTARKTGSGNQRADSCCKAKARCLDSWSRARHR